MILQALVRCYEALAERGELEKPGWSPVKVSWGLELDVDGQVKSLLPLGSMDAKSKQFSRTMTLPNKLKSTSRASSNFLWDNSEYILGLGKKENTTEKNFQACVWRHQEILKDVKHPFAQAIVKFFDGWKPENSFENPIIKTNIKELIKGGNIVFAMEDSNEELQFAHDVPEIRRAWDETYISMGNEEVGRCLVTGEKTPIAILHPSISGIYGAKSFGALLVSFNMEASESYGKEQGRNAPVGKYAAFAYGAALNYMVGHADFHGRLGDTTLVYWAEGAEPAYGSAFMAMMGMGGEDKNEITQKELRGLLTALCQGNTVKWENVPLNPENRFYILGIAPNASRLSVCFFLQDSFGALVTHYQKHQERLNIVRPAFDERETLSMWALLRETAIKSPNKPPKFQRQLVEEMLRAVLTGSLYPSALYTQTEIRLRAEKDINRGKAAMIKAYLLRNVVEQQKDQTHIYKEVLDVELNEQSTYLPYRLGRLFAVLEAVQQKANPNINTTIKDRYFNSGCATPALVFPTLLRLAQSHLSKIGGGAAVYYDKMITELLGDVTQSYPPRLSLQDQGIFQIGYYHQKQKLFTKKEEKDNG